MDNLLGLVAEYTFDGFLEKMHLKEGRDYEWNKRKIEQWTEVDSRLYDFKLRDSTCFEIASVRPTYQFAMLKDAEYKKQSKYFVPVQIEELTYSALVSGEDFWLKFDASKPEATQISLKELETLKTPTENSFGIAVIKGFDETAKILKGANGWHYGRQGEFPTKRHAAWYKELNELKSPSELTKIIEAALDLPHKMPEERFEQSHLF